MSTAPPEKERRELLHASDRLLDQVEELRLQGRRGTPPELQARILALAGEIGVPLPAQPPRALAGAHDRVFLMQRQLMRGVSGPRVGSGSSMAAPKAALTQLALPDREAFNSWEGWIDQVQLTVQRAYDRTRYLDAQAAAAGRLPGVAGQVLAEHRRTEAEEARQNWQELAREAELNIAYPITLDPPPGLPSSGQLQLADVAIDVDAGEVRRGGEQVSLTPAEFSYLVVLAANPGRVLTREAIQQVVNGDDPRLGARSRAIDVHLSNLRAKLGGEYIETARGAGFRASGRLDAGAFEDVGLHEQAQAASSEWDQGDWGSRLKAQPPSVGNDRDAGR